jgi:hypothetical protein
MADGIDVAMPAQSPVPRSVKVVGGLGILFGCLGILSASQQMMMPRMFEMQKQTFEGMRTMPAMQQGKVPFPPPELLKLIEVPDWYESWGFAIQLASLAVAGFYLFAAIRLFQLAPGAVRLFCLAVAIAILAALAKGSIAYAAGGMLAFWGVGGSTTSVVINTVLLLVIATTDHSALPTRRAA